MKKIIFDAHQDVLSHVKNIKNGQAVFQTGFAELVGSPAKLITASVFLEPQESASLSRSEKLNFIQAQIAEHIEIIRNNKKLKLIKSKKDLEDLTVSDATGILLHIEGADFAAEENLDSLDCLYASGLRSVGLVWGQKNNLAADCKSAGGLTGLGKKFVAKANALGIIIDLAHANEETFQDVLSASRKPVMVSHGNCFALCGEKRNFKNEQLRQIGEKRGVQGIFFSAKYVGSKKGLQMDDVLAHLAHAYALAPEAVMIGSDFGGITSGLVPELENIGGFEKLMEAISRKLGKAAATKIGYKNYLNFLRKVL